MIFRGLFFEHNADIGQKDHFWMDTNYIRGRRVFLDNDTPYGHHEAVYFGRIRDVIRSVRSALQQADPIRREPHETA